VSKKGMARRIEHLEGQVEAMAMMLDAATNILAMETGQSVDDVHQRLMRGYLAGFDAIDRFVDGGDPAPHNMPQEAQESSETKD